jgi:hypothetical protein
MKPYSRAKALAVAGLLALSLSPFSVIADADSPKLQQDFERFLQWFPGEYDNNEQVWQQGVDEVAEEDRLEHIHHIFLPVEAPAIGENTFFVRQYMADDYENVYRQRLYNMKQDEETGLVQLQIFSFKDEAKYRNTDQDSSIIESVTVEEVRNMPGCDVFWSYRGDHYIGEMKEKACFYFSERMGKNIYITDTLTLTDSEIWINDRAFDEEGNKIFGSDEPHKNRKVRYFKGWAAVQKKLIDESAAEDEMIFIGGLRMHNEGQVIPLITEEGVNTGYSVELAQLTYQNTHTEILKLALIDKDGVSFTYIWADPQARRIGINLRWMQVGMTDETL